MQGQTDSHLTPAQAPQDRDLEVLLTGGSRLAARVNP